MVFKAFICTHPIILSKNWKMRFKWRVFVKFFWVHFLYLLEFNDVDIVKQLKSYKIEHFQRKRIFLTQIKHFFYQHFEKLFNWNFISKCEVFYLFFLPPPFLRINGLFVKIFMQIGVSQLRPNPAFFFWSLAIHCIGVYFPSFFRSLLPRNILKIFYVLEAEKLCLVAKSQMSKDFFSNALWYFFFSL